MSSRSDRGIDCEQRFRAGPLGAAQVTCLGIDVVIPTGPCEMTHVVADVVCAQYGWQTMMNNLPALYSTVISAADGRLLALRCRSHSLDGAPSTSGWRPASAWAAFGRLAASERVSRRLAASGPSASALPKRPGGATSASRGAPRLVDGPALRRPADEATSQPRFLSSAGARRVSIGPTATPHNVPPAASAPVTAL